MVLANTRTALIGFTIGFALVLAACDSNEPKEKKTGQALVSVNGKEVTMLQLNEEIKRANVRPEQYEAASKQLLESLIVRQLILDEAVSNKLDRTPDVMQARDRANAQVIAQAYMQGIVSKIAKPSQAEIDEYFQKHPEFFSQRKQFDLITVRVATKDLSSELKKTIDAAKSVDQVVTWLDKNKVPYQRSLASRSSTDLPPQMAKMLQEKSKDTIFIVNEQENSLLISVNAIKDSPIALAVAAPQIERFLLNQKYKEATDAEVARLRTAAKIEYLNAKAPESSAAEKQAAPQAAPSADNATNNLNLTEPASDSSIERGIMGLK
ncbi:EpsD family peptidyl-prolyl cis-trans isomerase [Nitrosomonas oligotropha]|uniref:EpsD family peptidyl-prolyl cis-trans isomerase n=1 Tax=Nitrosomonas oligotropha TaxID=42354 RepID=UPI0013706905|nr:EpsD family peptidyl-prolyl cis-trans isomerase [Nitrosomonas oligotropha]MXS82520.1 peptidyl-prolyl cis-trans isomerase, EpsD family [Nitrosomonas oligotropha]